MVSLTRMLVQASENQIGLGHPVLPTGNLHSVSRLVWVIAMWSQLWFWIIRLDQLSDGAKPRPVKQVCNCTLTFGLSESPRSGPSEQ